MDGSLLFGLPAGQLRALNLDDSASFPAGLLRDNFFAAGDANFRGGVRLTTRDVDGDGAADIVTGSGDGAAGNHVWLPEAPLEHQRQGGHVRCLQQVSLSKPCKTLKHLLELQE